MLGSGQVGFKLVALKHISIESQSANYAWIFVSNLSEAISDVETNEKKSPIANNKLIIKKIDLSILFHHW